MRPFLFTRPVFWAEESACHLHHLQTDSSVTGEEWRAQALATTQARSESKIPLDPQIRLIPYNMPETRLNSRVCCAGYVQSIIDFLKTLPGIRGLVEREHSKMMVTSLLLSETSGNSGGVLVLL